MARAPGATSQPQRPVNSATVVQSEARPDVRPRRREPVRISRMPPIVKPMPPPTHPVRQWLRGGIGSLPNAHAVPVEPELIRIRGGAPGVARPRPPWFAYFRLSYVK